MENVGEAVGRKVEAFGGGGMRGAAGGIGDEQAFAERADDEKLVGQRGGGGIEIGGFVALADAKDLGVRG